MITSRAFPTLHPVCDQVLRIICQRKRRRRRTLHLRAELTRDLHFDLVDVVDIILALEQHFHLTIPDEVSLRVVGDLVHYVVMHVPQAAAQVSTPGLIGHIFSRYDSFRDSVPH